MQKKFPLEVTGHPQFSVNSLINFLVSKLRIIEGWKFVTNESKDYLSINLKEKWMVK